MVLVGPAGAGKSRFAAGYRRAEVLQLDRIRGLVAGDECGPSATPAALAWLYWMVTERLAAREMAVVAAADAEAADRKALLAVARESSHLDWAAAALFVTPLEVCLARNAARPRPCTGWRPGRRVPEDVLRAQHAAVAATSPSQLMAEGWRSVLVVDEHGRVVREYLHGQVVREYGLPAGSSAGVEGWPPCTAAPVEIRATETTRQLAALVVPARRCRGDGWVVSPPLCSSDLSLEGSQ